MTSSDARPKKTVVLVEDDAPLQRQLIEILSCPADIECLYAVSSAEEAMEKIPSQPPDVILMDINLPGNSGVDAHEAVSLAAGVGDPAPIEASSCGVSVARP